MGDKNIEDEPAQLPIYKRGRTNFPGKEHSSRSILSRQCKSEQRKNAFKFLGSDDNRYIAVKKLSPVQKSRAKG